MSLAIILVQPLFVYRGKNHLFNESIPQSYFLYILQ